MSEIAETVNRIKLSMTNTRTTYSKNEGYCEKCRGTGWEFFVDDEGVKRTRECSCGMIKRELEERQRSFAEIPAVFRDLRLETFSTAVYTDKTMINDAVGVIKYFMQNVEKMIDDGIGLYISSSTKGSGKTRMAASIANELMHDYGYPVKFATSIQIINAIKATWDKKNTESESALLAHLTRIKVLVFDDFGTESVKDWIGERFYHIINERYVNNLPTIYTSNYRLDQLEYDDRITDRILEKSLQVIFPEESVRKKIAEQRENEMLKARGE